MNRVSRRIPTVDPFIDARELEPLLRLPGSRRQRLGVAGIVSAAIGLAILVPGNQQEVAGTTLQGCEGEQPVPEGQPQAQAIMNTVEGVTTPDELARLPVKDIDGQTRQYRVFMAQGAPVGAKIPTSC